LFGHPNKLLGPSSKLEKITLEILVLQDYKTSICRNCTEQCRMYFGPSKISFWAKYNRILDLVAHKKKWTSTSERSLYEGATWEK